jgi:hypothetical protein
MPCFLRGLLEFIFDLDLVLRLLDLLHDGCNSRSQSLRFPAEFRQEYDSMYDANFKHVFPDRLREFESAWTA